MKKAHSILLMLSIVSLVGCGAVKNDPETSRPVSARAEKADQTPVEKSETSDATSLAAKELAKLRGEWQLISTRSAGVDLPTHAIKDTRVTIQGKKKTVALISGEVIASDVIIEIDPSTTPKIWDERVVIDSGEQLIIRGIYKLEGDVLTRCHGAADEDRPADFVSEKDKAFSALHVFNRVASNDDQIESTR